MRQKPRLAILLTPVTIWLVLFSLIPLGMMASYSFQGSTTGAVDGVFTLMNYERFLTNASFQGVLWRSMIIALVTALFSVVMAYPIAYFLTFHAGKSGMVLLTLLIAPAWTSELLRILAWKLMLGTNGGISFIFSQLGLLHPDSPLIQFGPVTVVITLVYTWIPFAVMPIYASLGRIERSLLEASADLGEGPVRSFTRVTLPLSMAGVLASFFYVFVPCLGEWITPAMVGGTTGIMFGNLIQDQFARALNWPLGAAFSLVMLLAALVLTILMTRIVPLSDLMEAG
jgi:spermidine/putrescine transport system permease protein